MNALIIIYIQNNEIIENIFDAFAFFHILNPKTKNKVKINVGNNLKTPV